MPIHRSRSGFWGVVPKRGPSAVIGAPHTTVGGGSDINPIPPPTGARRVMRSAQGPVLLDRAGLMGPLGCPMQTWRSPGQRLRHSLAGAMLPHEVECRCEPHEQVRTRVQCPAGRIDPNVFSLSHPISHPLAPSRGR